MNKLEIRFNDFLIYTPWYYSIGIISSSSSTTNIVVMI